MTEYVCGLMVSKCGHSVALVLKAKPAWQKGKWNGVGGKVEPGETPLDAMIREFQEETGNETAPGEWRQGVVLTTPADTVIHFYFGRAADTYRMNPKGSPEPTAWHPLKELPGNLIPNLRWLVPLATDDTIGLPVHVRDVGDHRAV